ncbi:hypothetical protein LOCC1_G005056 [Lachnellula occidentalis]|uniref:HNH nuclease domain-containing protein n=1 Tax=Lachnellula occidentalis TaxID=215460 RepID=A0A8H8UE54_9HELO|nr:hypothetical protein LOCC1_G005056 [Lachnellula occidentalis]
MASPQQADEDYNLSSDERLGLLQRLQDAFGDGPPHFWAACHLCDTEMLLVLVQIAQINPGTIRVIAGQTRSMVACWNQSARISSRTTTPQMSPMSEKIPPSGSAASSRTGSLQGTDSPPTKKLKFSISRSRLARDSAAQRDSYRCVLTGQPSIDVAHIYPFCLIKEESDAFGTRHSFWDMLRNFWPEEKVAAWEAEIFPNGTNDLGIETARNLITLSKDAHNMWNRGAFALKPISVSDDNTTLTIQLFWQARLEDIKATMNLLATPQSTKDLDCNIGAFEFGGPSTLFDSRKNPIRKVKSGDIFELTTDDLEARPLPSFALLEMQWFLQRITGMAGAADVEEDWGEGDWDDEIGNPGLDEIGGTSFISGDLTTSDPAAPVLGSDYILPMMNASKHYNTGE